MVIRVHPGYIPGYLGGYDNTELSVVIQLDHTAQNGVGEWFGHAGKTKSRPRWRNVKMDARASLPLWRAVQTTLILFLPVTAIIEDTGDSMASRGKMGGGGMRERTNEACERCGTL